MKRLEPQEALIDGVAKPAAPEDLDALYRRYGAWLTNALRRRFGPMITPVVEDLVQETYVRIAPYQAAGTIRHPQAFLLRVASNLTRDHLRRETRNPASPARASPAVESGAENHQAAEQLAALQLKEVILALPVQYRDVFVMNRFGGLTYEEIAHHTGLSVKTVEWRMTRALALCAQRLQD